MRAGAPPRLGRRREVEARELRCTRTARPCRSNSTSFVGRERETAAIGAAFADHQLVTLIGAGGVGKTRSVVEVADDLLPQLPDGAWLIELGAIEAADTLPHFIAAVLSVQHSASAKNYMAMSSSLSRDLGQLLKKP